jgi:hypothetical protein
MKLPNARGPLAFTLLLAIAGSGLSACTKRSQPSDSTSSDAAVRGDSIGDLTGPPRSADSPSTRTPSRPASPLPVDTNAQRRNDGSMLNPPIHRTNPRDDGSTPGAAPPALSGDLLAQINALAKPGGCASAGDCQTLPVGRKACGGPRAYVVFCPKSTNVVALRARIAELDRVDQEAAKHTISDCSLVVPPSVTLVGGACRAQNAGQVEVH